jgi:Spy/CpxP family protein refolding chaperone
MTKLTLFAVAGLMLASPLQAQHQHGAAQAGGAQPAEAGHQCPMHAAQGDHTADPAHAMMPMMIMKHGDMLKLTPSQKTALEGLQAAHKQMCEKNKAAMKTAGEAAAKLLEAPRPDMAAYEARLRETADLQVKCKLDMAVTGQKAKALLTAEQLQHLSHMGASGH